MAKIIPFCSSSKGNSVLVSLNGVNILIDIGCSFKTLNTYLAHFDYSISDISAVLITHEHTDHVNGLNTLIKHTKIPVFATKGTIDGMVKKSLIASDLIDCIFYDIKKFSIKTDVEINYFNTPHDANECVGYIIKSNGYSFAYCTDLGEVTEEIKSAVAGNDIVFLESNYCPNLLDSNKRYPYFLKKRIKSSLGHLSNQQSAEFSSFLVKNGTKRIILGHLSQENNTPQTAYNCHLETHLKHDLKIGTDYLMFVAEAIHSGRVVAV